MSASAPVAAALFDLDGTLADTEALTAAALVAACAEAGMPGRPPVEEFLALSGLPLEAIVARLGLPPRVTDLLEEAAGGLTGQAKLFDGALTLLSMLRARSVRVGVITGKRRVRTVAMLEHLGVADLVERVVTPDDPPAGKPAPDGVWWLCRAFDVPPQRAVLVGDAPADLQAGAAAGVRTIACLWGTGHPAELARHQPWRTVTRFGDLILLLDRLTTPTGPAPPAQAAKLAPPSPRSPGAPTHP